MAAASPGDAWAVGASGTGGALTEHWNGRAWTLVPGPAGGLLTGVAVLSPASAWAVGFWTVNSAAIIEHWDGAAWTWPPVLSRPGPPGSPRLGMPNWPIRAEG